MHTTPHSLLEALRQPDAARSWARFVDLYAPLLHGWAARAGLQESDAADLVQDVFAVLLRKLPGFRHNGSESFRAWLRAVTMNKLRDGKRRAAVIASVPISDDPAASDFANDYWEREFRDDLVRRAMALMKNDFEPTTWQACWEFVANGRSAADVARQLGISENAVFIAKCRVIRRLRQELRGMWD